MASQLIKETKTWRADSEEEALEMIEDEKKNADGYVINKSGYTMKVKKSKGEIVDVAYITTIERNYDI